MAKGTGRSIGQAMRAFLDSVPVQERTTRQQVNYLLGVRTGATDRRVGQLLGVAPVRVRAWSAGIISPSKTNRAGIKALYEQWWHLNTNPRIEAMMKISTDPVGPIKVRDQERAHIILERSTRRNWNEIRRAPAEKMSAGFGEWLVGVLAIEIPYVTFDEPGNYTIETTEP